jgi:hypothetical protein
VAEMDGPDQRPDRQRRVGHILLDRGALMISSLCCIFADHIDCQYSLCGCRCHV